MTLLILSLFALAEETTTEIDFEEVEIVGEVKRPSFAYIEVTKRPVFRPIVDLCLRQTFQNDLIIDLN